MKNAVNIILLSLVLSTKTWAVTYEDTFDLTRVYSFYGIKSISAEECGIPPEYAQTYQVRETYTFPIGTEAQIHTRDYTTNDEWSPPVEVRQETISFPGVSARWDVYPEKTQLPSHSSLTIPLQVFASISQDLNEYKISLADLIMNRSVRFSIESMNALTTPKLKLGRIELELRSPYSIPTKYFAPKPYAQAVSSSNRYQLVSMGISNENLENYFITDPKTIAWAIECRDGYYIVGSKAGKNHNPTLMK